VRWPSQARWLRSPLGAATATMLLALVIVAVVAPPLLGARANHINTLAIEQGISWSHPLGTDDLGHDVLARVLVATRASLWLAVLTTLLGAAFGVALGSLPVVLGRRLGRLIVAAINLLFAFPGLLLAIFLAMIFGVGARGAVLALAVALAPWFGRLTHTTASRVAGADYVSAARMMRVPRRRILIRHVLPNIAEPIVVNVTGQIGSTLLSFSALSYIGFGVQPPAYDWGRMIADALPNIYTDPAAALAPCVAIVVAGITFVLAGELLAQVLAREVSARHGRVLSKRILRSITQLPKGAALRARSVEQEPVLKLENLRVMFPSAAGPLKPVDGISLSVAPGEVVGVVGESGSGKSLTAAAASLLVPYPGVAQASVHEIRGADVQKVRAKDINRYLGTSLALVFQDPMSSLNPVMRVGRQLAEVTEVHRQTSRRVASARAVESLRAVKIPMPEMRAQQYPRHFSGGMRQRASIGMGLMADPALLIADEPTTALDVTVQREIISLLQQLRQDRQLAILFISHDIAVVGGLASRVLVMYAGRIVEELPAAALGSAAAHPYTRALVASIPDMATDRSSPLATIPGRPPDLRSLPKGCAFAERCQFADATCRESAPSLLPFAPGRQVACWHPQGVDVEVTEMPDGFGTVAGS